jgi:hypothetical protein
MPASTVSRQRLSGVATNLGFIVIANTATTIHSITAATYIDEVTLWAMNKSTTVQTLIISDGTNNFTVTLSPKDTPGNDGQIPILEGYLMKGTSSLTITGSTASNVVVNGTVRRWGA